MRPKKKKAYKRPTYKRPTNGWPFQPSRDVEKLMGEILKLTGDKLGDRSWIINEALRSFLGTDVDSFLAILEIRIGEMREAQKTLSEGKNAAKSAEKKRVVLSRIPHNGGSDAP